jgi:hypothetical protein
MEILIQTETGRIFKCSQCEAIHIEFKNLNFNLKEREFWKFAQYILDIDGKKCESRNLNSNFKRKIILPVGSGNFNVLFNKEELEEFKSLLSFQKRFSPYQKTIKAGKFEFTSNLN